MVKKTQYSVVLTTNSIVHHITNLCNAFLHNEFVKEFVLVITNEMSAEYKSLGNDDYIDHDVITIIDAAKDTETAKRVINTFDIVIGTYYVEQLLHQRVVSGKPTYIFSERVFKKYDDCSWESFIKNAIRFIKYRLKLSKFNFFNNNCYYLLAGKHAIKDYIRLGIKQDQILVFGYYPDGVKEKRSQETVLDNFPPPSI